MNFNIAISSFSSIKQTNVSINYRDKIHGTILDRSKGSKKSQSEFDPIINTIDSIICKNELKKDTGILPPGFLGVTGDYIVFERPPEYKNIFIIPKQVDSIRDDSEQLVYRIPIPWTLYFVQMTSFINPDTNIIDYYPSNVRMHFMRTNLRSHDQEVFLPPIPNFYTNADLCRPMFSSMEETERYSKDIAGCIQAAYDWIWNCGTNLDLTEASLQMFTQFYNSDVNKTLFRLNHTKIPANINFQSYYLDMHYLDLLFQSWQSIDISDVCDLEWPASSEMKSFSRDYSSIIYERLPEYLNSIGQNLQYEEHYDEEEDHYYQCDYDECECHHVINSYDIKDFLRWANIWPPQPLTYLKSFRLFIESTSHKSHDIGHYSAEFAAELWRMNLNSIILNSSNVSDVI